ncbi:elongation factor 2 family protein [Striga asiatica]|uniref:Elongation factor 2 family protein n=1 Tax=Striga asiatica TaxID=4170 RepID=A0A5A7NZU2_STRAF|nr:elongation factor 2 family protein [Striga asiatica]
MDSKKGTCSVERMQLIMENKHNIRNVSLVGHVNHGKTTVIDSMLAAAGIIHEDIVGNVRSTDTRADEIECGLSIKSTAISLCYNLSSKVLNCFKGKQQGSEFLVNLILSGTPALRLTDGALVVVDCLEGVRVQTKTVIRQAGPTGVDTHCPCYKQIGPSFFFMNGKEAYQVMHRINKVIDQVNAVIATYSSALLGDWQVYPEEGTVVFSSGIDGWAFNIKRFAQMYAAKYEGDVYFDTVTKKWSSRTTGSCTCQRGFVLLCYNQIKEIMGLCLNGQKDILWPKLEKVGININLDEKEKLIGKSLLTRVMRKWWPASDALLEAIIVHFPSPAIAQKYRVESLYSGPLDDVYASAITGCNSDGPRR